MRTLLPTLLLGSSLLLAQEKPKPASPKVLYWISLVFAPGKKIKAMLCRAKLKACCRG